MTGMVIGGLDVEIAVDIIRFSDGKLDPVSLANQELMNFIERSIETVPDIWGNNLHTVAQKYAPSLWERIKNAEGGILENTVDQRRPLIWKELTIPAGSEVRMSYGDSYHYAKVSGGQIIYNGQSYSPSQWAGAVANETSRNAWRDIWFKLPLAKTWMPAQLMREQAKEQMHQRNGVQIAQFP